MLTVEVARVFYPRDMEHIGDNLRCNNNVRTSNASNEMRY